MGSPVWRLLIASGFTASGNQNEPLDPDDSDPAKLPTIEREVYFVSSSSATLPAKLCASSDGQFYSGTTSNSTSLRIPCGGYALIGSGENSTTYQNGHPKRTYIGFLTGGTAGSDSTRYIDLGPSLALGMPVRNNTNSRSGAAGPDPETGVTVGTNVSAPVMLAIDSPHRLNVSEPLKTGSVDDYNTMETQGGISGQGALAGGAGVDMNGKYSQIYDIPFDQKRIDDTTTFKTDGTTPKYRMIYLQRLANPLKPYNNSPANADYNPYRTVDAMAVDLTVFNGLKASTTTEPGITAGTTTFETRQRGENNDAMSATATAGGTNTNMNLWKQEPVDKPAANWDTTSRVQTDHYFQNGLKHSLGYLNQPFGMPQATPLIGDPSQPFPWFTSFNRPYVSPLELMMVPTCSASKLLVNAGSVSTDANYHQYYCILGTASTGVNPYTPALNPNTLAGVAVPYPHLMNFFQSTASTATGAASSPQFHRILDFVGVPSPFVGTETWINPNYCASPYLPPFNRISAFREPGRINLNTIYSQEVFNGLMAGGFPLASDLNTLWGNFVKSRSGGTSTDVLAMPDSSKSTEFGQPFRSFGGFSPPAREIDSTLLRSYPTTTSQPLFQPASLSTNPPYNDANKNPYFRYQGLMRLSNLVTTRSNVYAVWITVGYFEVTPASQVHTTWTQPQLQATFPDGYCLGRELNIDTGDIERHRAFYIIDRTIPVGFQRGNDLNVDKAILVNRFIE